MIYSLYQIDFLSGTTSSLRLLSVGETLLAEVEPKVSQAADRYAPIHAPWSESAAKGGAQTDLTWGVIRNHASHAALRSYCFSQAAALPSGITGTLRVAIQGGDTWDISDVTVLSSATSPRVPTSSFQTITAYAITGGLISKFTPSAP